jgi:SPP1 family predicted phage head-tail adaptor
MIIEDAGEFRHKIQIVSGTYTKDASGFKTWTQTAVVLEPYAKIKTTKGFTLITLGTDFEKATTNFTIRFPITPITRDMRINYGGKVYEIQYLNNVDEANVVLEIQAKEITH